jgi:YfiH family protein
MPVETIINDEKVDSVETLAESGFYWRERGGIRVLVCRTLEDAGFVDGFSTRLGGVSPFPVNDLNLAGYDEDSAENIEENRRRFLGVFDGDHRLATAWQVHGNGVKIVATKHDVADGSAKFDALASDLPNVVVGVKTADCVPVLIGDPKNMAYAAIHAGWRGTAYGIVRKAVDALSANFGSRSGDLICAIGPAACGRNYEVGSDVIDAFSRSMEKNDRYFTPTREGHALVDLQLANKDQLVDSGVEPAKTFTAPLCTMERTDLFFSYRIEKKRYGKTGRLLSVIGKR